MSTRKAGDKLKAAFKKMEKPASKGGTGGTFKSPEGRDEFAEKILKNKDDYSAKMVKKANFYKNIISK